MISPRLVLTRYVAPLSVLLSAGGVVFGPGERAAQTQGSVTLTVVAEVEEPHGGVIRGSDGALFGTSRLGPGSQGCGYVFRLDPQSGGTFNLTILHAFAGAPNEGCEPHGELVEGLDGALYGTTRYGGPNADVFRAPRGTGTIYRIEKSGGPPTLIRPFAGMDSQSRWLEGYGPIAGLTLGPDGNFYGTTPAGGSGNQQAPPPGTLFRFTPAGELDVLHDFGVFPATDHSPQDGLTLVDGNLYGTMTATGGFDQAGGLFRVTLGGALSRVFTLPYNQCQSRECYPLGANPLAAPTEAAGAIYILGSSFGAPPGGYGSIVRVEADGTGTLVHGFSGGADGGSPHLALTPGADGYLYGLTSAIDQTGPTIFRVATDGSSFQTLHEFVASGAGPQGRLLEISPGQFIGTSASGLTNGGFVYRLSVSASNRAPVASTSAETTLEDTPVSGVLSATDADNDPLTFAIVTNGALGTATVTNASTGAFTYVPFANAFGTDTFTFRASDGTAESNTATVTVAITPVNDAPVALDSTFPAVEDTPLSASFQATDVDSATLAFSIVANGLRGTAVLTNASTGAFTYTPNPNANGTDVVSFQVFDGALVSNVGAFTINIAAVNDAPRAHARSIWVLEDTSTAVTLMGSDPDDQAIAFVVTGEPAHGQLGGVPPNLTYTPALNYNGSDSFNFEVTAAGMASASATVRIVVSPEVWTSNGPEGGTFEALVVDPSDPAVIYAGSGGGIFKSVDGGARWINYSMGLSDSSLRRVSSDSTRAIAVDPSNSNILYVATGKGVAKTLDAGATWNYLNLAAVATVLTVDPAAPATIYAAGSGRLFKSIDGGGTWIDSSAGLPGGAVIRSLLVDPLAHDTLYMTTNAGVFKSTSAAASWSPINEGLTFVDTSGIALHSASSTLWVGAGNRVFKSLNGGLSWSDASAGLPSGQYGALIVDASGPNIIYAGNRFGGLFKSTNGGLNWTATGMRSDVGALVLAQHALVPDALYIGTASRGVFRSTDAGATWSAANRGLTASSVAALALDLTSAFTAFAGTGGFGVQKTLDGGSSWSSSSSGIPGDFMLSVAVVPLFPSTVFAAPNQGLFKSNNAGSSWFSSGLPFDQIYSIAMTPDGQTIYVGTNPSPAVKKSTDGGLSWSAASNGLPASIVRSLAVDPTNRLTVYAGTNAGVFRSIDGGNTWVSRSNGIPLPAIVFLVMDRTNPAVLYVVATDGSSRRLFKTVDAGSSWMQLPWDEPITALAIHPSTSTTLYASSLFSGVFRSQDGGITWHGVTAGLTNGYVNALAVDSSGAPYAATNAGGVFRLQTSANDAPTAPDQTTEVLEDAQASISLAASDPDGQALTFMIVTPPSHGTLTGAAPNVTYTPDPNYNGPDNFTFKASDGVDDSNVATVSITVTPVNDAPEAADGILAATEDLPASGTLSATDVDGPAPTFSLVSSGSLGTASIMDAATGAFTYTPNVNASGTDTFTFKANDGSLDSNVATVTVTISPVNDAPLAQDGTVTLVAGTSATGTLVATDVDSAALAYALVTSGAKGTATIIDATTGAYTYTANSGASGTDTFTFTASDGLATSNVATVTVAITPAANQAPLVVTGAPATAMYNTTFTVSTSGGSGTGAVTFAASGACSNSNGGAVITMISGIGTCSIVATKAADGQYNAATSDPAFVSAIAAGQGPLTVTGAPASAGFATTFIVATTGGSGTGVVTFSASGACSNASGGALITMTSGTGTCSITATKAGDATYLPITSDVVEVVAAKAATGIIRTVAGNGTAGFSGDGGAALSASLQTPTAVAADAAGNLFIADANNHRVRKVTPAGVITTVAGTGVQGFNGDGGLASAARLSAPQGLAIDAAGNLLIADRNNQRIRKVDAAGVITTIAGTGTAGFSGDGGQATLANLAFPTRITVDALGDVFIADVNNQRIRKVDPNGVITTVAGSGASGFSGDGGPATLASFNLPLGIVTDAAGNLFIADSDNRRVRKVDAAGIITTIAGTGVLGSGGDGGAATSATFRSPSGVAVDAAGNLFIADQNGQRIRRVDPAGIIATVAGTGTPGFSGDGGAATAAQLFSPFDVAVDVSSGTLFLADRSNNRVRSVDRTLTVTGAPSSATFNTSFTVASIGGSGTGAVTFAASGACSTVSGDALITMTSGTGACTITATKATDANYLAATSAEVIVAAIKAAQSTLTVTGAPASAAVNTSFTVSTSGGSGTGAVTFSASGACSNTSGGALMTMTASTGTCSIVATKAADDQYNEATSAPALVATGKATQATLIVTGAPATAAYDTSFTVGTSGGSGSGAVTFQASGVCSNANGGALITMSSGTGTCSIVATKAADDQYDEATSAAAPVTATKAPQATLTVSGAPASAANGTSFTVSTSGGSGTGAVTFAATGACSNSAGGALISMTAGTGTCSIAATKGADANYDEATSAPVSVTATPAASPAAPSALTATANSANQITLAWSDNSTGEDGFKIERSPTNQNNFVQVAAVNANATSYADTGLSPATKYYYRVRAYVTTASLDSPYSNAANATTLSAPAAPTTLSAAAASSSQINLTWTDKSTNETGFKISRSLDGTAFAPIATVGQNIRSYADTSGLTPDTTYFYVVQAFNANGDSKPSNTATTSTLPAPTPPPAPSGLVASAVSSSQISLLWTDDAANETGFKVERSTDGTTFAQVALLGANTTTYVDSGLTASTLYSYRVRATNASGDSQYSNTASATTLDAGATAPAAPGNLAALAQTGPSVSLTWTDNSNNEQGFAIERSLDGTTFAQLATVGPNVNTYSDTGLRGNTNYYYRVRAFNGAGNSAYSNTSSARTRNK